MRIGQRTTTVEDGVVTLHHHYKCDLCAETVDVTRSYPEGERMPFGLQTSWPLPPDGWIAMAPVTPGGPFFLPDFPVYCSWACAAGVVSDHREAER